MFLAGISPNMEIDSVAGFRREGIRYPSKVPSNKGEEIARLVPWVAPARKVAAII